ncbi:MAG: extracellular solute-binding protein [Lachnospiraceae bacterium]|nr:extracellular solute-binding protein [Lachnospiraceae bacterium]
MRKNQGKRIWRQNRKRGTWRRGVLLALLVLFCVVFLSACHGSQETKEAFEVPEEFDASRDYEITFWAKNDTNKTQVAIYEQAIEDFEALYPNITVNIRLYTDYSDIYNDVITNIATDTTPNVCITYPDHIATYLTGDNQVVALDDLMTDEKYGLGGSELLFDSPTVDEVVPQFLEECQIDGTYYALPYMRSTEACYVNKTYVEALGFELPETLTWDFIWEVCEAAMEKDADGNFAVNGQSVMIPFIYKSTDNMMITMLKQLDAGYSTAAGDVLLFNDTTTELLYEIAERAENREFSTFKISGYPANFLNAGQCIFAIDSTAGATWMGTDAPLLDISEDKLVEFETVVMAVPQYDTGNVQMISQGPSICIFNKEDSQEVLASWLFAQYLLTNDVQIAYSQTEGYLPVTTKAQESDEYQDYLSRSGEDNSTYYSVKIDAAKLLLDNIENTFTTAVFNGSTSLRSAAGQLIENTTKSARRGETIDDAYFETLYEDVTSLYRLDQIEAADDEDSGGLKDLGPLPQTSVILLGSLAAVWALILLYLLWQAVKTRKSGGD